MIGIVYKNDNVKSFLLCKSINFYYNPIDKMYEIVEDLLPHKKRGGVVLLGAYADKDYAEMIFEEIYHAVAEGKKVYCMPKDRGLK